MNKKNAVFLIEGIALFIICIFSKMVLLSYICIILHECVHIYIAYLFKVDVKKFQVHITGASCTFLDVDRLSLNKKIILYVSGPLFNLIVFGILVVTNSIFRSNLYLQNLMYINLLLFIFNMLPAYPLDGARVYESYLLKRTSYRSARSILFVLSIIIAFAFVGLFILSICIHRINYSFIVAFILIMVSAVTEKRKTSYIIMSDLARKENNFKEQKYMENKYYSVYFKSSLIEIMSIIDKSKFNYIYILDDKLKIIKMMSEIEVIDALKGYGNITLEEYLDKINI